MSVSPNGFSFLSGGTTLHVRRAHLDIAAEKGLKPGREAALKRAESPKQSPEPTG